MRATNWRTAACDAAGGTPTLISRLKDAISSPDMLTEHGIGTIKRAETRRYKDPVALELMQQIKTAVDRANLMTPGKVL